MAGTGGALLPHLSARRRTEVVDTVFNMVGGVERMADWANKPENYGEFLTKVWAKGMAKPMHVELTQSESLEGLLDRLASENAKVINGDATEIE